MAYCDSCARLIRENDKLRAALAEVYAVANDAMLHVLGERDRPDLTDVFNTMARAYEWLPDDAKARMSRTAPSAPSVAGREQEGT
jgi:hypothetical protein